MLLHILYGKPSPSRSLSPFTLHPSLIYSSLCLRCVSAADGCVGASTHTFLPHLTAFLLLHRRQAQRAGVQRRLSEGRRKRTKLASEALWGPDAAPVLSAQSVLVCPRLRESHTAACEELSSPFLPVLPSCTELLLFALDPASWFSWQGPSRQRTRAEDSAEGRAELQRAQVPSAPLKCVPLQRTRLRSAAPGAPAGSGWGCTDSEAGSSSSAWLWSSKAGK